MAKIPSHIEEALSDYIRELSKLITINSVFLFGSFARGNWNQESDIDVAIFSENFKEQDRIELGTFLLKKTRKYALDIQPIPFDEKDLLNYEDNPFVREIVENGIKLF